jgi:hypothetical protein
LLTRFVGSERAFELYLGLGSGKVDVVGTGDGNGGLERSFEGQVDSVLG